MVHTARRMAVVEDGLVEQVEHEKEVTNKQTRNKTVMAKPATSRQDLKMALMKRGMPASGAVCC